MENDIYSAVHDEIEHCRDENNENLEARVRCFAYWNRNTKLFIHKIAFQNVCEMAAILSWGIWVKHSVPLASAVYGFHCLMHEWIDAMFYCFTCDSLHWRHNDHDGVSNHQPHGCLLNRLFRRRSKKTSKLRVTGLCVGNSPGPVNSPHKGPVTRKNASIWWRHHAK